MSKLTTIKNGKGDKPRPINNYEKYINNWDDIFKKTKKDVANEDKKCDTKES
jgi:hypothetical protein